MQSSLSTTYDLRIYASEGAQVAVQLASRDGYTDEFLISFAKAVKGLPWPAGQTPQISLTKTAREDVIYTADASASSPVFS
jgi:hypothetical protein